TNVMNGMGTVTTYYFKYWMGDIGLMSIASLTSLVAPVSLIFFPLLAKKFGTSRILQACAVFGIIGMVIRTIGGPNLATIVLGGAFQGIALMPISLMINTYIIDCMDYGEWKSGVRGEGMVASIVNFSGKVGGAIASGIVGLVMGLAGYDGSLEVQSAGAMNAIVGLYNYLPLAMCILMLVLSLMYQVDKIRPQMEADLKARHEH
ncbi:MAG: MFS transporter, partial [Lachnospiraceae bacterium]|nr:MFS transporter [Lachnospiraceae bacterium]